MVAVVVAADQPPFRNMVLVGTGGGATLSVERRLRAETSEGGCEQHRSIIATESAEIGGVCRASGASLIPKHPPAACWRTSPQLFAAVGNPLPHICE